MDMNPASAEIVRYRSGAGSYAAFRGHPIHPMMVPLVVGTFTAAVIADIAFASTHDPFWARSASWLLLTALLTGCATGLAGAADFLSVDRARNLPIAATHALGNTLFLVLVAIDYYRRLEHAASVPPGGLSLTLLAMIVMGASGWLGGSMVYRHGIGVSPGIGVGDEPGAGTLDETRLAARAERSTATPSGLKSSSGQRDVGDPLVQPAVTTEPAASQGTLAEDQAA
jgi:uncharacterized membrane protein